MRRNDRSKSKRSTSRWVSNWPGPNGLFPDPGFPAIRATRGSDAESGGKFPRVHSSGNNGAKSPRLPSDLRFFRGRGGVLQGEAERGIAKMIAGERFTVTVGQWKRKFELTQRFESGISRKVSDDGSGLAAPQLGADLPMGSFDDGESNRVFCGKVRSAGAGTTHIDSFLVP